MTTEQKRFKVTIEDQVDGEVKVDNTDSLVLISLGDSKELSESAHEAAVAVSLMGHFNGSAFVTALTGLYSGIIDSADISIPVMKKVSDAAFKNLILNSSLSSMLSDDAPEEAREIFGKLDEIAEILRKKAESN